MALWLMHTYAAKLCGRFLKEIEKASLEERAFLLGNIAPDWVNFVPEGRKLYRAKSHYKGHDYSVLRLEDFRREHLLKVSNPVEKAFYEGYATHLLLDFRWSKNIFDRYAPMFGERPKYYEEAIRWDGEIDKHWEGAHECRIFLSQSPEIFKDISVDSDFIFPEGLEKLKKQARIFATEPLPLERPYIFKQEDIEKTLQEFQEDYQIFFQNSK